MKSAIKLSEAMQQSTAELLHIKNIVDVCAFASEARRVLAQIDLAKQILPSIGEKLDQIIDCGSEWREHEDSTGVVLKQISYRLEDIVNRLDVR